MSTLLTYVNSTGYDPFTNQQYPDGIPTLRGVDHIYALLSMGFVVEERTNGLIIQLDKDTFYKRFEKELAPKKPEPVRQEEPVIKTTEEKVIKKVK